MNEKLTLILLKLAEDPSLLPQAKQQLEAITSDELNIFEPWENQFCIRIKRIPNLTLNEFFQVFFQTVHNYVPEKKSQLTDTILKPIFMAVAKLPFAQRPRDFYQNIITNTHRFSWQKRKNTLIGEFLPSEWLPSLLLFDRPNDLSLHTILSQASDEEFQLLYREIKTFFGEGFSEYLLELDSNVLSLFLKKLSFNEITTLKLAELANQSLSVCQAIGDWLGTVSSFHQEVWQWVQEQKLLSIPGVICALPIKIEHTLNIPEENRDTDKEEGLYEFCQLFIENQETGLATRSITEQMLSFAVLMFYMAKRRTKFQNDPNYYGAARQKTDMAEELLERYKTATPFLRAFADANSIPETLIPLLAVLMGVEDNHFNGYLEIIYAPVLPPPIKKPLGEEEKEYPGYFEGFSGQKNPKVDVKSDAQSPILKCNGYSMNPKISAAIIGLLGLAIALALCLSPLAAPFWLIPVLVIGGAVVGAATALAMNHRSRRSLVPSPINEPEDSRSDYLAGIPENIPDNSNDKIESLFQPDNLTGKHTTNTQSLKGKF